MHTHKMHPRECRTFKQIQTTNPIWLLFKVFSLRKGMFSEKIMQEQNRTTSPLQSEKVERSEDRDRYSHSYSLCSYCDSPPQDDTEEVIYSEGEQFEGDL